MKAFESKSLLSWGNLNIPLFGITNDWYGNPLRQPSAFSLAIDTQNLWFISTGQTAASILPHAAPHQFTPELWKADVAELFLANSETGNYLETNLAANGAWWASTFASPRTPTDSQPDFLSAISTNSNADGTTWTSTLSISLKFLEEHIGPISKLSANVSFIQNSPDQIFLSAVKLPGAEPDFHQPSSFTSLSPIAIPEF